MINIKTMIFFLFVIILGISCSPKDKTALDQVSKKIVEEINFLQESEIQLASPKILVDSILFKESASIRILNIVENGVVSYSLDDGAKQKYLEPFQITQTNLLKVTGKKEGYKNSEEVYLNLIEIPHQKMEATISLSHPPSETYPGNGPASLLDLQRGTLNFKEGNYWSGFQNSEIEIDLKLAKSLPLTKVYCSILMDHNAWIFQPKEIQIWDREKEIGREEISIPKEQKDAKLNFITVNLPAGIYSDLKVKIINLKEIPAWHPGAGTSPWLFIDEIIVK